MPVTIGIPYNVFLVLFLRGTSFVFFGTNSSGPLKSVSCMFKSLNALNLLQHSLNGVPYDIGD